MFNKWFFALLFFSQLVQSQSLRKIDSLNKVLQTAKADTEQVKILNALSWEYRNTNFKKSLDNTDQAIALSLKNNYLLGLSDAYSYKGIVLRNMGDYTLALDYYLKALKIAEKVNNQSQIGYGYNNIGEIFKIQGNYKDAIVNIQKAISIFIRIDNKRGIGYGYLRLGEVYQANNDLNNALINYEKSLEIRQKANDLHGISTSMNRIGFIYLLQKKTDLAINFFNRSRELFEKNKDNRGITGILADLSRAYQDKQDFQKAIYFANKSLQMAQALPSPEYIKKSSQILYEIYASQKDYEKALNYQSLFLAAKDSLQQEDLHREIAKMQANYALEKKQAELDLIKKDQIIRDDAFRIQNLVIISGGLVLILLLGLLLMLFLNNRQRKLVNDQLKSQNLKIESQKNEIETQRDNLNELLADLTKKNQIIQKKNEDTHASILYAKNIQNALLSKNIELNLHLPEHFILFEPRDIVSGDFYWSAYKKNNGEEKVILAAVDCTGHGVPGAFMSLIGDSLLNEIIHDLEIHEPAQILNELHTRVQKTLNQHQNKNRDGMEVALCVINLTQKTLTFAGAGNPLIYFQNGQLVQTKGDIHSIGGLRAQVDYNFSQSVIDISVPTTFYIFSDGFQDQFGGERKRKFMATRFRDLLTEVHQLPMQTQLTTIQNRLADWIGQGQEKQTDDITLIGVRI